MSVNECRTGHRGNPRGPEGITNVITKIVFDILHYLIAVFDHVHLPIGMRIVAALISLQGLGILFITLHLHKAQHTTLSSQY